MGSRSPRTRAPTGHLTKSSAGSAGTRRTRCRRPVPPRARGFPVRAEDSGHASGTPGCETKLVAGSKRLLAVDSEAVQKLAGQAEYARMLTPKARLEGKQMGPDDATRPVGRDAVSRGEAIRYRKRSRGRLRAATAGAGLASVLAAGGVAYTLPGSHAATLADRASPGSGSATASRAQSSTSRAAKPSKSGSSDGLQRTTAPSASSGTAEVTSGSS